MTSTTSKVFLDSSILVEYERSERTDLLDHLCEHQQYQLCISETVVSEYTFHMLGLYGNKAPLTLKVNRQIKQTLIEADLEVVLQQFIFLPSSPAFIPLYLSYMRQYNLLPNDALILATCKLHGIHTLASYDSDFATACIAEGIRLVQTVADLAA